MGQGSRGREAHHSRITPDGREEALKPLLRFVLSASFVVSATGGPGFQAVMMIGGTMKRSPHPSSADDESISVLVEDLDPHRNSIALGAIGID